ncbi:MAG: hypothetical protein WKF94_03085 [Solirubrobacteraceae bacterium]
MKPYLTLTREQRTRALDAEYELLAAAQQAWRDGWHPHELPGRVCAEAHRLGVVVWPTFVGRIARTARATTYHQRDWNTYIERNSTMTNPNPDSST